MNAISDTLGHPEDMAQERLPLLARPHYWVVTVDHGRLGIMYIFTGLAFLLIGGVEASLIRQQLAVSENTLHSPRVFNCLFTMHGTTMVFFLAGQ